MIKFKTSIHDTKKIKPLEIFNMFFNIKKFSKYKLKKLCIHPIK
jgi:hypothetical protein